MTMLSSEGIELVKYTSRFWLWLRVDHKDPEHSIEVGDLAFGLHRIQTKTTVSLTYSM